MKVDMVVPSKSTKPHMPRGTFISKSPEKQKAKADNVQLDQSIKGSDAMMRLVVGYAGEE